MRTVFFLLLFANVLFAAWIYYTGTLPGPEARMIEQQVRPDQIKVIGPDEVKRIAASRKPPPSCLEWGALATGDVGRAEEALESLATGLKATQRRIEGETAGWWVFIPPLATRAAATARAAELKKQGAEEFFVIQDDGKYRYAISLGVFRSEDAAKARLDTLTKKGVKGALAAPREGTTARVYLQLREVPEPVRARLPELRQGFPGTEVRECPP